MSDAVARLLSPTAGNGANAPKTVAPVTAGDGGGSRNTVLIPQPSQALRSLEAGDVLEAKIDARLPDGQVRIATTRFGTLQATWPNAPAPGTSIQLQVLSSGPPARLRIVPTAPGQLPQPPLGGVSTGSAEILSSGARPVSPPATPPSQSPARAQAIRPGDTLQGRFFPVPARADATGLPRAAPGLATAPTQPLPLTVRVLALQPPHHGGPELPAGGSDALRATVVSSGGNHTRLQTGSGDFTIRGTSLPPGTRLTLQIVAQPGIMLPLSAADQEAQQITALARGWPALAESLEILAGTAPGAAARFGANRLPQPGSRLATGIVFFLSAIRSNRLQDWLGAELVRTLHEQGNGALRGRLTEDFSKLAQLATESVSGEWRTALLPLLHDGVLQQLRIYLRDRDGDGPTNDADDDPGTRFVVEAELSRLGALQLDGLVRQKRFDLIVRSHQPLPGPIRTHIREIFSQSGAAANFAGAVSFQVEPDFDIAPLEQLAGHAVGVFA